MAVAPAQRREGISLARVAARVATRLGAGVLPSLSTAEHLLGRRRTHGSAVRRVEGRGETCLPSGDGIRPVGRGMGLGLGVEPFSAADSHVHTTHTMHMPCTSYAATLSGSREVRFHNASGLTRAELSIAASLAPVWQSSWSCCL
eukprot:scaffold133566_cov75-Phaeocystis_antarctica.AAC.3